MQEKKIYIFNRVAHKLMLVISRQVNQKSPVTTSINEIATLELMR